LTDERVEKSFLRSGVWPARFVFPQKIGQ